MERQTLCRWKGHLGMGEVGRRAEKGEVKRDKMQYMCVFIHHNEYIRYVCQTKQIPSLKKTKRQTLKIQTF